MSPGHSFQDVSNSGSSHVHMGDNNYYGIEAKHSPTQECLRSLAFLEMNDRPNDIDGAAEGKCEWLLQHQTYRN